MEPGMCGSKVREWEGVGGTAVAAVAAVPTAVGPRSPPMNLPAILAAADPRKSTPFPSLTRGENSQTVTHPPSHPP